MASSQPELCPVTRCRALLSAQTGNVTEVREFLRGQSLSLQNLVYEDASLSADERDFFRTVFSNFDQVAFDGNSSPAALALSLHRLTFDVFCQCDQANRHLWIAELFEIDLLIEGWLLQNEGPVKHDTVYGSLAERGHGDSEADPLIHAEDFAA
ncbi:MAG: hypothetical protein ACFB21_05735 [Opitutales bacterium]